MVANLPAKFSTFEAVTVEKMEVEAELMNLKAKYEWHARRGRGEDGEVGEGEGGEERTEGSGQRSGRKNNR